MIKSMTGFGRGSADGEHVKATVEIRAVNNSHTDVHVRLPQELPSMEIAIKKQVAAALKRGRVDATIVLERGTTSSYSVNRDAVRSYLDAIQVLKDEFKLAGEVPVGLEALRPGGPADQRRRAQRSAALELKQLGAIVGEPGAGRPGRVLRAAEGVEEGGEIRHRIVPDFCVCGLILAQAAVVLRNHRRVQLRLPSAHPCQNTFGQGFPAWGSGGPLGRRAPGPPAHPRAPAERGVGATLAAIPPPAPPGRGAGAQRRVQGGPARRGEGARPQPPRTCRHA